MPGLKPARPLALIVDDLPASRKDMIDHVEALDHAYVEASCVKEARDRFHERQPSYVLLDLQIPTTKDKLAKISHGKALLDEVIRDAPTTPVVVVTGEGKTFSHAMDVVHRHPHGLVTFVPKPFGDDDPDSPNLTDEINRVLNKARRLTANGDSEALSGAPARISESPSDIGVVDVCILRRWRKQRVFCLVNGVEQHFSPREQEILAAFAKAQARRSDDPGRHLLELDAEIFGIDVEYNNRHTAFSRLRKKLAGYLSPDHPPVLQPGSDKNHYTLGCYAIDTGKIK